ncbi:MAG: hypothetical protein DI570_08785 [Phenylobacterium zucineum]|nr:MAG: hypothetical protein DI570_08785 [Phenylobacterium zucineum]
MTSKVFVLGGAQTDFARNFAREGGDLFAMFKTVLDAGFASTGIEPEEVQAAHVGNFTAEIFCRQGHLGGFFAVAEPRLDGIPTQRHEAACASGSMALLSAAAEIEAGRYDLIAVLGIEMMRNVPGDQAALNIGGPAMWSGRERLDAKYPWPDVFSDLGDEYDRRYGLKHAHLAEIARINFANAKRNPNAQTRGWNFNNASFTEDDEANPVVSGRIRKQDCGQVSDGAAIVFLASERAAKAWADRRGRTLDSVARIEGWGHRSSHISFEPKLEKSRGEPYVFPHVRRAVTDAYARAGIAGPDGLQGAEVHDCFTTTEYMAIDHLGLSAPGESWKPIEAGIIGPGGAMPINPSGGLMGLGHPVGATGVRMMLDCARQVTGDAGDYQVEGARRFAMLNIGGSTTTTACFVVGAG